MLSKEYKEYFWKFIKLLEDNNVFWFPIAGTLLGFHREGDFLEHDDDIDIGVYAPNYDKIKDLVANSEEFEFFFIWRREMAIKAKDTKERYKIDVFFLEACNDCTCIYSYKSNPFTKKWDIEWRMRFSKDAFSIFDETDIQGHKVYMPINSDEILTQEYGNWRVPDKNWNTYKAPSYDKDYREVAMIMTAFLRFDKLKKCVESIEKHNPIEQYRLYIANQSPYNEIEEEYFNELRKQGHVVINVPFNCGLSYSRNRLVEASKEPFVWILEDDFVFTEDTSVHKFIEILNHRSDMGIVGGTLDKRSYTYRLMLDTENNKLSYIPLINTITQQTVRTSMQPSVGFTYCDLVLNFALVKRAVFDDLMWDEELKLVEHSAFYLQLQKLNKWKIAHTNEVLALHDSKSNNPEEYKYLRQKLNVDKYLQVFLDKTNLKTMSNVQHLKENK